MSRPTDQHAPSLKPGSAGRTPFAPRLIKIAGGAFILAVVVSLTLLVRFDQRQNRLAALAKYRDDSHTEAERWSRTLNHAFHDLRLRMRTIARLHGVRAIDRDARKLDDDTRLTVQEIYNDLASTCAISISEVYIVPLDLDPDHTDPSGQQPDEPVMAFDHLIVGRDAEGVHDAANPNVPEIETYEYRLMVRQLAWMREHTPRETKEMWDDYPAICGPEVITCDNTRYSPSHPDDRDRSGLVYSVPIFGLDGELRGCVSAVFLSAALRDALPPVNAAIRAAGSSYTVQSTETTVCDLNQDLPAYLQSAPPLLYAERFNLDVRDASSSWEFWTARPNTDFESDPRVIAAARFGFYGYTLTALVGLGLALGGALVVSRYRDIHARSAELERSIRERTVELDRALEQAQAASRAKTEFLATMSHEIRTPMTAILGYADLLMEEGDLHLAPESRIQAICTMRRNGKLLLSIINDTLDLSKIEAGKLELERVPCSPAALARETVSLVRPRAAEKSLELALTFDGPIPEHIASDPTRLKQVLLNLTSNAIKFTEHGRVELRVAFEQRDPDATSVTFAIIDTGIGMSPQEIGRLFQPFTQADSSMSRRFGGAGLGLVISKRLAEMLGGDISVKSQAGVGTTFTCRIGTGPVASLKLIHPSHESISSDPSAQSSDIPLSLPKRVLLAEDGSDNQRLISFLLKRAGAEVVIAPNGVVAVEYALAHRDPAHEHYHRGQPFDIILMDMQMPELDGYGATKLLRSRRYTGPIVALTAHAMAEDRARCIDAGCDDYATKPINKRLLLETCLRWTTPSRAAAA